MPLSTASWRAARVFAHIALAALLTLATAPLRLAQPPLPWYPRLVSWWYRRLWPMLGLAVEVRGAPATDVLLIANHVSWLDIPVLGACGPLTFLSKAEVRRWPLVGWLASTAGTLYIERGAHQATRLAADIGDAIRGGRPVVIFPEGTTGDGHGLRRFHSRLFAAAQQPGLRVQPVAIRYGNDAAPDPVAPFIGDDRLLPHLWRVLRHPGLQVRVSFLAPIATTDLDRRGLAERARAAISDALLPPDAIGRVAPVSATLAR